MGTAALNKLLSLHFNSYTGERWCTVKRPINEQRLFDVELNFVGPHVHRA